MPRFRTKNLQKPLEIEAVQVAAQPPAELTQDVARKKISFTAEGALIAVPGGSYLAPTGDWIVRAADGSLYSLTDQSFSMMYEEA